MKLPHYMILPQKTMVTLANFIPQSLIALKMIKGMGKKKSEKFGEEILNIIVSFCKEENIEQSVENLPENTLSEKILPKKIKEETKKISFDLFNEGKAISQIAKERNLSKTTIEGHLAYFIGTGDIPVSKLVSQEITELISMHFKENDDLRMAPVKAALGEKVSWSDIRFVMQHIEFLRKSENGIQQVVES
jgi:uncharacterized protein YpbB